MMEIATAIKRLKVQDNFDLPVLKSHKRDRNAKVILFTISRTGRKIHSICTLTSHVCIANSGMKPMVRI